MPENIVLGVPQVDPVRGCPRLVRGVPVTPLGVLPDVSLGGQRLLEQVPFRLEGVGGSCLGLWRNSCLLVHPDFLIPWHIR